MKADGDAVTGKWDQQDLKGNFKDGKLVLDFPLTVPEYDLQGTLKVDATVENGKIKGNWTYNEYYGSLSATKAE